VAASGRPDTLAAPAWVGQMARMQRDGIHTKPLSPRGAGGDGGGDDSGVNGGLGTPRPVHTAPPKVAALIEAARSASEHALKAVSTQPLYATAHSTGHLQATAGQPLVPDTDTADRWLQEATEAIEQAEELVAKRIPASTAKKKKKTAQTRQHAPLAEASSRRSRARDTRPHHYPPAPRRAAALLEIS
jgi:hypothetical protein